MTRAQTASPELAAARNAWADPFTEGGHEELAVLTAAAPLGTVVEGDGFPSLTVAQEFTDRIGCRVVRLTGDGKPAEPSSWCRCEPPPDRWVYYETWHPTAWRLAHGWVDAACRGLVQSG